MNNKSYRSLDSVTEAHDSQAKFEPKKKFAKLLSFQHRKFSPFSFALFGLLIVASVAHSQSTTGPIDTSAPDKAAIVTVLDTYTKAIANNDEALFMSTMLDDQIPVLAASYKPSLPASLKSKDMNMLSGLRDGFFHSKTRYRVTFDHMSIQQDHSLAAVFVHFFTHIEPNGPVLDGWKTLQMVNVGGQWKIASELYTIERVPSASHGTDAK